MAGIFTSAAQSLLRAQDRQAQRAEQERRRQIEADALKRQQALDAENAAEREIKMAALEAGLREQGVLPGSEAKPYELPMFDGLASGQPSSGASMTMPAETRYKPLGSTGRVLDTMNSQGAQSRVQEFTKRKQAEKDAETKRRHDLILAKQKAEADEAARRQSLIDQLDLHKKKRKFDIDNPTPQRPSASDPEGDGPRDKNTYVRRRMEHYMKRQTDRYGDPVEGTGLDRMKARQEAEKDWEALHGSAVPSEATKPVSMNDGDGIPPEWIAAARADPEYAAYLESMGVTLA